jgi:hypothetical protein
MLRAFEQGGIRDLYHATSAVTRGFGFSGLIQRTAPFCCLLHYKKGCGESILTQILTGPYSVASYDTQGDVEELYILRWILTGLDFFGLSANLKSVSKQGSYLRFKYQI